MFLILCKDFVEQELIKLNKKHDARVMLGKLGGRGTMRCMHRFLFSICFTYPTLVKEVKNKKFVQ